MDGIQDSSNAVLDGDQRRDACCTSSPCTSGYGSIHHIIGGATDVILWKRRRVSFGVIVVATIAWLLIEKSGLSFLSICSDVLFLLTVLLFLRANYVLYRKGQPEDLPELVLSEEMVNNAAASFRVKINRVLLIAHDITHGKDFRLFFVVVVCLWLLSVIGSLVSFTTLAYIGTIISITIPALYSKYEGMLSRFTGSITQRFSQHFRIVDENGTLHHSMPNDKDD
ncbi:hypothetical protein V2J09_017549 [Rumex salicifolius]